MILVNHVGTSVISCVKDELMVLVDDIKKVTDEKVVLAFNSQKAVAKITAKGFDIQTTFQVINQANENITILPVHLVGGNDLKQLENNIKDIKILPPLLQSESDCSELALILKELVDPTRQTLFVGHGTRDTSNYLYQTLENEMMKLGMKVAVLTLNDSVNNFLGDQKIFIMPLFTIAGHHVQMDLFHGPQCIKEQLLAMGHDVTFSDKGLLSYEAIRALYVRKIG